jgi:hypothetical protein
MNHPHEKHLKHQITLINKKMMDKIDNTSTLAVVIIITVLAIFVYFLKKWINKQKRIESNTTSDDLLHELNFKVQYSIVCDTSELTLIQCIKEAKQNPSIDKKKLKIIEDKFIRRFDVLHLVDEFSAMHLDHAYNEAKVKYSETLERLGEN